MSYLRTETIENWISDWCLSDAARPFGPEALRYAPLAMSAFLEAACAARDVMPNELEPSDVQPGLNAVLKKKWPAAVESRFGDMCASLLGYLETAGRLGGGGELAQLVRARGRQFTPQTIVRPGAKVGRNDPCPCGSGKKYKKCCLHLLDQ